MAEHPDNYPTETVMLHPSMGMWFDPEAEEVVLQIMEMNSDPGDSSARWRVVVRLPITEFEDLREG